MRRPWTPALVAKLHHLEQGTKLSRAQIAEALGHGLTAGAVAAKMCRLRRSGHDYPRRSSHFQRTDWTPEMVAELRRLKQDKTKGAKIAAALGLTDLTHGAISGKVYRLRHQAAVQPIEYQTPSMPLLKFMEARL